MNIACRAAALSDADAVADLYLASRKTFLPYAPLAHSDEDVRWWVSNVLIASGGVTVAVAPQGKYSGGIVGMSAVTRDADGGWGWIEQLYIAPGAVGRGIGSVLLERAKCELSSPIRLYTFQENAGARRFYERHGFVAVEFGDGTGNEEKCPDVLYEWRG